jgi:hypothetical protein
MGTMPTPSGPVEKNNLISWQTHQKKSGRDILNCLGREGEWACSSGGHLESVWRFQPHLSLNIWPKTPKELTPTPKIAISNDKKNKLTRPVKIYKPTFKKTCQKKHLCLPSGKLTVCYGKSPCLMGKSTISMAINIENHHV